MVDTCCNVMLDISMCKGWVGVVVVLLCWLSSLIQFVLNHDLSLVLSRFQWRTDFVSFILVWVGLILDRPHKDMPWPCLVCWHTTQHNDLETSDCGWSFLQTYGIYSRQRAVACWLLLWKAATQGYMEPAVQNMSFIYAALPTPCGAGDSNEGPLSAFVGCCSGACFCSQLLVRETLSVVCLLFSLGCLLFLFHLGILCRGKSAEYSVEDVSQFSPASCLECLYYMMSVWQVCGAMF